MVYVTRGRNSNSDLDIDPYNDHDVMVYFSQIHNLSYISYGKTFNCALFWFKERIYVFNSIVIANSIIAKNISITYMTSILVAVTRC